MNRCCPALWEWLLVLTPDVFNPFQLPLRLQQPPPFCFVPSSLFGFTTGIVASAPVFYKAAVSIWLPAAPACCLTALLRAALMDRRLKARLPVRGRPSASNNNLDLQRLRWTDAFEEFRPFTDKCFTSQHPSS